MMATGVISFRADEEALRFVREHGLNPNQVAKEAFARELRRIRAQGALEWLKQHPMTLGEPAEQIIRRMRDER